MIATKSWQVGETKTSVFCGVMGIKCSHSIKCLKKQKTITIDKMIPLPSNLATQRCSYIHIEFSAIEWHCPRPPRSPPIYSPYQSLLAFPPPLLPSCLPSPRCTETAITSADDTAPAWTPHVPPHFIGRVTFLDSPWRHEVHPLGGHWSASEHLFFSWAVGWDMTLSLS